MIFFEKIQSRFVLFIFVCGCSVVAGNPTSSKGVSPNNNGKLNIVIFDAPVDDAKSVTIKVIGVVIRKFPKLFNKFREICKTNSNTDSSPKIPELECQEDLSPIAHTFEKPISIDLLKLQQGYGKSLLLDWEIPSGNYKELGILLDPGTPPKITFNNGTEENLFLSRDYKRVGETENFTPEKTEEINILSEFSISQNSKTDILVHVDLRKSIRPLDGLEAGEIESLKKLGFQKRFDSHQGIYDPKNAVALKGQDFSTDIKIVCAIAYTRQVEAEPIARKVLEDQPPIYNMPTNLKERCRFDTGEGSMMESSIVSEGRFFMSNLQIETPYIIVGLKAMDELVMLSQKTIFERIGQYRILPNDIKREADSWTHQEYVE